MKLPTQVLTSLLAALAVFSQCTFTSSVYADNTVIVDKQAIASGKNKKEYYTKCKVSIYNTNKYCFQRGDRGVYVQNVLSILSEIGYYQGRSTNQFDVGVERSVIRFQQDYRLKSSDGIVGNETLLHLCKVRSKGCKPSDDNGCYTGSPRGIVSCLNDFRSDSEKDRSYFNK